MDLTALGRFHIAPGYDPAFPATWVWQDRSGDVNHPEGEAAAVRITGGRGDEVGAVEAGSALLEVDNAGGHYCSENPLGRWYGLLATGCPARWGTICGAEAWTAATSNGWGVPDVGTSWSLAGTASDWSSSGGVGQVSQSAINVVRTAELVGGNARNGEATFTASVPAIATGASLVTGLVARRTAGVNQVWFCIDWGLSGVLGVRIKRDTGSITDLGSGSAGTYTAGQRIKARCVWDGTDLRMRIWPESGSEPTTWTVTATDTQCTGSSVGLQFWRVSGNTNTSPVAFAVDNLEVEAVEIVGTLPDLPVRWDPTASVSWAPLEIAGITRRLSQGEDLIESPIHRQLVSKNPMGYWPLEDEGGTTIAASGATRGSPAILTGVTLGSTDCPPGASAAATLTTAGSSKIAGRVTRWTVPQDGYAGMCYARLPTLPASSAPVPAQKLLEVTAAGTVTRWVIYATSTGFYIEGYLSDGTLQVNTGSFAYGIDPTKWFALQLETGESGGTVSWALIWHQVGSTTFSSGSGSYSGTADRTTGGIAHAPVDGTLISHLWLGDDLLPFVNAIFMQVSAAFPGELASDRLKRIFATEKGIPIAIEPGASEPLGPQKIGQLLDNARAAEAGDLGVLYETGAGYGYRPRRARYNRATGMTLAIAAAGDVGEAPQPAKTDQYTRNVWKVIRDGGSSAIDSDEDHIAKNGRRPDTATVLINSDARLPDQASWRVHLGTWGEYRWPQIVIDLTDRPAQLAAWRGRPFGARITVTGVPSQGPIGADLDLIVEGFSQEITSASWRVTLNCSPARPWDVGVYGTSRYGSASTILVGSMTGSSTAVKIGSDPADVWSTTGTPYDWMVAGEQMTVTSMGATTVDATLTAGGFESGTAGWDAVNVTLTQSSTVAKTGTFSGLMTVVGSPTVAYIRKSTSVASRVVPGMRYTASAWVQSTAALTDVRVTIDWSDSDHDYLSTSDSGPASLTAGSWVQRVVTVTAPAGAAYAKYGPTIGSSPTAGTFLYTDDILLTSSTVLYQTAILTRAVNDIVKAHVAGETVQLAPSGRYAL